MKKVYIVTVVLFLLLLNAFQFSWNQFAYRLDMVAIPTEEIAIEVGKSILVGAYGEGVLQMEAYEAVEVKNAWLVYGHYSDGLWSMPQIVIRKSDGKILSMGIYY